MKINSHLKSCFSGIACLALVTSFVVAQEPFGFPPEPENEVGQDDPIIVRPQDDPIIVRPQDDRVPRRPFEQPNDEVENPDQVVLLNSKFAGWQEAAVGMKNGARISNALRANWIMVDSNGSFEARVIPTEGAEVTGMIVYLMNMGRLVKDTSVDENGRFEFSNVREGAYALVGWGPEGFFAFGLDILEHDPDHSNVASDTINVMAFQNTTSINTDWIQFFTPRVNFRIYGRFSSGQGKDDPAALYGIEGLTRNLPQAYPATSINSHPIKRTAEGGFIGRVHQLTSDSGRPVDVRSTKVMLLQADEVIASADCDNYGVFRFPSVEPGNYGLAAVGVDGLGLIGIDVEDEADNPEIVMNDSGEMTNRQTPYPFDFCLVSSETVGWLNNYAAELAYRRALLAPRRPDPNADRKTCTNCDGMGCNQCGGSGLCKSRSQSFEDWAANCAGQHQKTKLGSGYILSEGSKDLRRVMQRGNNLFENAFYGSGSLNDSGQSYGDNYNGYGNPSTDGNYYQGYDNGYNTAPGAPINGGYGPTPSGGLPPN